MKHIDDKTSTREQKHPFFYPISNHPSNCRLCNQSHADRDSHHSRKRPLDTQPLRPQTIITIKMALATKTESLKIFEKLKTKPANKVCTPLPSYHLSLLVSQADLPNSGVFRLRRKGSHLVVCAFWNLRLPRLCVPPQTIRRPC